MNIFRRLAEPSTHAGIAAVVAAASPFVAPALHTTPVAVQGIAAALQAFFGALAVAIPEKGAGK